MERRLILRCRAAAALLGLAAVLFFGFGWRATATLERGLWLGAAVIVGLAAIGVWRGVPVLLKAVRRSTATVALLFLLLAVMPLTDTAGRPATAAARALWFGPMIAWALLVAGLLWPLAPRSEPLAAPARPVHARSGPGRRKRRRHRRASN